MKTYHIFATFGPIWSQSRIDFVQPQIDDGGSTRYNGVIAVYIRVRQDSNGLHTEFQSFVEVPTLQHTAIRMAAQIISIS